MGMGFSACQVLTVEEYFIEEQCPEEFQGFVDSFEECSEFDSIDDFARCHGALENRPVGGASKPATQYDDL